MTSKMSTQSGPQVFVHIPEPTSGAALYVFHLVEALAAIHPRLSLFCPDNFVYRKDVAAAGVGVIELGARGISHASLASRIQRNLSFFAMAARRQWATTSRGDVIHYQFPPHFPLGLVLFALAAIRGLQNCFYRA